MGIVLKKSNKYLGSFEDFKKFVARKMKVACEKHETFNGYDFALVDMPSYDITVNLDTQEDSNVVYSAYNNATGWYGIQELKSPFDDASDDRQFISDYYGGGSFACIVIDTIYHDTDYNNGINMLTAKCTICDKDTVVWEEK